MAACKPHSKAGIKCLQFFAARQPVEAADGRVDGMDGPPAEHFEQFVAVLFQLQPAIDFVRDGPGPLPARSRNRESRARAAGARAARGSRSIRRSTAAAAAGESPARSCTPNAASSACTAAHLVGHRADAADAGRDVGHVFERAAAQKRLEQPRRFDRSSAARLRPGRRAGGRASPPSPSTRVSASTRIVRDCAACFDDGSFGAAHRVLWMPARRRAGRSRRGTPGRNR